MNGPGASDGLRHHAELLLRQGRFAEAEEKLREALQANPLDGALLHHLAVCQYLQDDGAQRALVTVRDAIAGDPNISAHHALHARVLADLKRSDEAREAAATAVALDPHDPGAHNAMTYVLLRDGKWADAEASARRALALDADDEDAANHLATALRLQNKMDENAAQIRGMLERDPENSHTHASAGWSALQTGRRDDAERHFLEALRLAPANELARDGLLEAFKGRSPVYRAYLSWCFFMQRLGPGRQWAVIIGLYLLSRFARVLFTDGMAPLGVAITTIYLLFALWTFVARGVGGVLLLFDRLARHVLRRREKLEAVFVGGGVMAGVVLLTLGVVSGWFPAAIWGGTGIVAAIPFACTFHNDRAIGRVLFGTAAAYIVAVGTLLGAALALESPLALAFRGHISTALLLCIATSWLANVPFLRRVD